MIVDTSALVAILFEEPEQDAFTTILSVTDDLRMTAPNWLELFLVLDGRTDGSAARKAEALRTKLEIRVVPFDADLALIARDAYRRYGRGNHPARLNFGDCMAYALAKSTDEALLFKGQDFTQTDVTPALA